MFPRYLVKEKTRRSAVDVSGEELYGTSFPRARSRSPSNTRRFNYKDGLCS